jgi:hypothetical protein
MKPTPKAAALLEEMGRIDRMERGKICQMKGREHFNHQTWQKGRNVVRYVPREEVDNLQAAIDGYARFTELAQHYADEIIRLTRQDHARSRRKTSNSRKNGSQKRPD